MVLLLLLLLVLLMSLKWVCQENVSKNVVDRLDKTGHCHWMEWTLLRSEEALLLFYYFCRMSIIRFLSAMAAVNCVMFRHMSTVQS